MNKKIKQTEKLSDVILSIKIGQGVDIQATRLASFKATVSRVNQTASVKYGFDYGDHVVDGYIKATRIEYVPRVKSA